MGLALAIEVQLTSIDCGVCGGVYAINEKYRNSKWQQGGGWHCPYCQASWGYFKDNENARLKRDLEDERKRKDAALARANESEANLAQALRREQTLKKRAKAGVCPCCNRTFQQLARHMNTKHPEFKA